MGRKRKNVDPLRPMPTGLYLHKDGRYRAPITGGGYHYFGKDYETATHDYRVWRGDTPTAEIATPLARGQRFPFSCTTSTEAATARSHWNLR